MIQKGGKATYRDACAYIEAIPRFTRKNRPSDTAELLKRLGHPEDSFSVIHVAGTNGKGSVCAFLESILRESGLRTGLFTSPHLSCIRERFQINRKMVSEQKFTEAFREVRTCVDGMLADGFPHPAYFEFLFAMGMLIFREEKTDAAVLETGLGGRLDATNAVRHPSLTVLTSISFDHMRILGNTIRQIAGEKAGIIKEGIPVIADGFPRDGFDVEEALDVIRRTSAGRKAPLTIVKKPLSDTEGCRYLPDGIEFSVNNRFYDHARVMVPFPADYQVENCLVAMTAAAVYLRKTGVFVQEKVLAGIRKTRWEGRMENIAPGLIVDGAHNTDGIRQFLKTAGRMAESQPAALLFSAVGDKDAENMIRELCEKRIFEYVVTTETGGSRRIPAWKLAGIFRKYTDVPVTACKDAGEALGKALAMREGRLLFCAGSLYLAGTVREAILKS